MRRHAWLDLLQTDSPLERGRKLVVQMVETFQAGGQPTIVESIDAVEVGRESGMPLAPVMIYGDDVTHVLTEEGIAYLYKARSLEHRKEMIAAVAGVTPIGMTSERGQARRRCGAMASSRCPRTSASTAARRRRSLLAAKSMADLVDWSDGLYEPPARFRSW